jgi:hypothetical protein
MKILGFLGLLIIIVIIIGANAKHLPIEDNDDDLELSGIDVRSFLKKHDEKDFNKPMNNLDCVLCAFNLVPCCAPNICIKKRLRPDECLELKPRN